MASRVTPRVFLIADLERAYRAFLRRVTEECRVIVLTTPSGKGTVVDSLHLDGEDGQPLMVELVFSHVSLAERARAARSSWATYQLRELDFGTYLTVLPRLSDRLVAPDISPDGGALEVEPLCLLAALEAEARGDEPDLVSVTRETSG